MRELTPDRLPLMPVDPRTARDPLHQEWEFALVELGKLREALPTADAPVITSRMLSLSEAIHEAIGRDDAWAANTSTLGTIKRSQLLDRYSIRQVLGALADALDLRDVDPAERASYTGRLITQLGDLLEHCAAAPPR